ncbi:MAG: hypothetical protein RLZZ387_2374 [Chloroflexota bacterium]|jgi:anti-sigma-K factor RskA
MTTPSDKEMDLLIAYALDELGPEESERADRLLAERPELRATLADLRAALDKLPYALPDPPPPADLRERTLAHATGRPAPRPAQRAGVKPGLWRRLSLGLGALSAALVLGIVLMWGQLGATRQELAQAQTELQRALAQQQQIAEVVAGSEVVAGLAGEGGRGTVLRTPSGETLIAAQLPPLAPGRVYQLWRIHGQEAPVSAGTFQVNEEGYALATLPAGATDAGTVFAVTDEPGPEGSPGPTTAPIIVGEAVGA